MKDVTAAIIIEKGKVLVARRAPGQSYAGRWEFPGGKVEPGETPEQCLKRELMEEFGVEIRINDFVAESIYEYPTDSIRLLAYLVKILDGDIRLSVHDDYHWVNPKSLLDYELLPADIPIAIKLKADFR